MSEISRILAALEAHRGEPAALATLVSVEGSSYRRPGARLLVLADGTRIGSISGGCLEDDLRLHALRVLESGAAQLTEYDTTLENDLVWGVGLGCQGVVRVLVERLEANRPQWTSVLRENLAARRPTGLSVAYEAGAGTVLGTRLHEGDQGAGPRGVFTERVAPPPSLAVFGAGDDARPLVRLAKEVGWHVAVVDSRPAYASRERFPEADRVVPEMAALEPGAFAVLMTHRYTEDVRLLRFLLSEPAAYVGVLGPRKRTERILAELRQGGFSPPAEAMGRLYAPVGLDLGSTTPESIALSILSEIQGRLGQRDPIHLRDRTGPIYG